MRLSQHEEYVRNLVLELFTREVKIVTYPVKSWISRDDIAEALRQKGYGVSLASDYGNAFLYMNGRIDGDELLVSSEEKLEGIVRYRYHQGRNSIKIESFDENVLTAALEDLIAT